MKRIAIPICACAIALTGCQNGPKPAESGPLGNPNAATWNENDPGKNPSPSPQPTVRSNVVATVNGLAVTEEQIIRPLMEAHGLNFLLYVVQLELARERARKEGLAVTPKDIADERMRRLDQMFNATVSTDQITGSDEEKLKFRMAEYERLFPKLQERLHVSEAEFNLAFETGAYLWKIADKELEGKITEEGLRDAFEIQYGGRIVVRIIKLSNQLEVAEVQRLLQEGKKFEEVARLKSRDLESAKNGGELRPFSMKERNWPEGFKAAAFALKEPGEISNPINTGPATYLIQLIRKIAPSAVKFEDHKEIVRKQLYNAMMTVRTDQLRQFLQAEARDAINITDPMLRKQYVERLERARSGGGAAAAGHLGQVINQDQRPSTQPATQPADQATNGRPEVARPPATRPGL